MKTHIKLPEYRMSKQNVKYKGWDVIALKNKWMTVCVAPNLGGRIIQLGLMEEELLFNNVNLHGVDIASAGFKEKTNWLNFGGEKIWPAPQGWDSEQQWPGPPDVILDSGFYSVSKDSSDSTAEYQVSLKSDVDPYTGLQILKDIALSEDSSRISVKATFINKSSSVKIWSIWPVIQLDTPDITTVDRYKIICPLNPESKFKGGFQIMHGLVNSPQYRVNSSGNFQVANQYLVGKVGLDADANWVAFCDKKMGNVLIATFEYDKKAIYPEDTSVQIWVQGKGLVYSRNRVNEYFEDPSKNFPYMEIELLSPLCEMQPDSQMMFEYQMLLCKIPEETEVITKNDVGVISSFMAIDVSGSCIQIKGKYGVFKEGVLKLVLNYDDAETILRKEPLVELEVSPAKGIDLAVELSDALGFEGNEASLSLQFFDLNNTYCGDLDHCTMLSKSKEIAINKEKTYEK